MAFASMKISNSTGLLLAFALGGSISLAVGLNGCNNTTIKCVRGLRRCGVGCADFNLDKFNCGACGVTCQLTQICQNGQCQCQPGATFCGGTCALTSSDPNNCGACGAACDGGVCQSGQCQPTCTLGFSRCGDAGSCFDLQSDSNHCGSCAAMCSDNQRCRTGGCRYDVVAACADAGQVFGLQVPADIRGSARTLGTSPLALGSVGGVLLSADDREQLLYQTNLSDFSLLGGLQRIGQGPRQVLVNGSLLYVVNEQSNTVQVFQWDAGQPDSGVVLADGGPAVSPDAGTPLGIALQSEVGFDAGAAPRSVAALGSSVFVTLYGGPSDGGVGAAGAGQRVVRVDVTNPQRPVVGESFPLDGGALLPRPTGATSHGGFIYVALSNLNFSDSPGAPGALAKIDPVSGTVQVISLRSDCYRPQWIAELGDGLVVSCAGNVGNPSGPAQLDLLDRNDQVVSDWRALCPVGDPGCIAPVLSRFVVIGSRIYAGDSLQGRLFVIERVSDALVEIRGLRTDAGVISGCPTGVGVTDIISVP